MNVFDQGKQVGILVAEDRLVSTLKKMANRLVPPIKIHRIALVDPLKNLRKRGCLCLNQQMNMVAHQDIGIEGKVITNVVVSQNSEIPLIVFSVSEDRLSLVATGDDVVKGPFKFDPWSPCHGIKISDHSLNVNTQV